MQIRLGSRTALGLKLGVLIAAAVVLRRFPPELFPYPPCPLYALTGLLCPGCGATRTLAALLQGHFAAAVQDNALFVVLLPCAVVYLPARGFAALTPSARSIGCGAGIIVVFTVLRNLL